MSGTPRTWNAVSRAWTTRNGTTRPGSSWTEKWRGKARWATCSSGSSSTRSIIVGSFRRTSDRWGRRCLQSTVRRRTTRGCDVKIRSVEKLEVLVRTVAAAVAAVGLAAASLAAQSANLPPGAMYGADSSYKVPRTPDGHPNLEGVWANNSVTPMTRPTQWKDKE